MASEVDADLQTVNVERDPRGPLQPAVILSPREKQLLRRFAKGKTDAYIALAAPSYRSASSANGSLANFTFGRRQNW
jgi:hypothetical protein